MSGQGGETQALLSELARVKAMFQQRAVLLHMGVNPDAPTKKTLHKAGPVNPQSPTGRICGFGSTPSTNEPGDQQFHQFAGSQPGEGAGVVPGRIMPAPIISNPCHDAEISRG